MKTLLLSTLILLSSNAFSQVWGRPGATWHYDWFGTASGGYIKVIYTADTLIQGHDCQKFSKTMHSFWYVNQQGDMATSSQVLPAEYTYFSGDTVFYLVDDGHFEILYDFSAAVDDTWKIRTTSMQPDCNDTSSIKVLETGMQQIDGQNLRFLVIADMDSTNAAGFSNSPMNNSFETPETKIFERIGNAQSGFLFPTMRNCSSSAVDFIQCKLICYEDNEVYYNPNDLHCEYFLDVEENKAINLSVAPNPVDQILSVNVAGENNRYEILSVTGQLIIHGKFSSVDNQLDVSNLKSGIYHLKVTDSLNNVGVIRFVKN